MPRLELPIISTRPDRRMASPDSRTRSLPPLLFLAACLWLAGPALAGLAFNFTQTTSVDLLAGGSMTFLASELQSFDLKYFLFVPKTYSAADPTLQPVFVDANSNSFRLQFTGLVSGALLNSVAFLPGLKFMQSQENNLYTAAIFAGQGGGLFSSYESKLSLGALNGVPNVADLLLSVPNTQYVCRRPE